MQTDFHSARQTNPSAAGGTCHCLVPAANGVGMGASAVAAGALLRTGSALAGGIKGLGMARRFAPEYVIGGGAVATASAAGAAGTSAGAGGLIGAVGIAATRGAST